MLVSKHGDPIMGIDIHLLTFPPAPPPVPIPHPHCGLVFDAADYIPFIGSTLSINSIPRSLAGSSGKAIPHIPMGGIWVPPPPMNEEEIFMGSMTVVADGSPLTFSNLPVLTCQSVGMIAPIRLKKSKKSFGMVLPLSMVVATPGGMPVMIGSIGLVPTIDMMGMAMKGAMAVLGPLAKMAKRAKGGALAKKWKTAATRFNKKVGAALDKVGLSKLRNKVQDAICSVTGHPVNVATGQLYTEAVDIELSGPIPFQLSRVWRSTSNHCGDLGYGWHHSYDEALYVVNDVCLVHLADGRVAEFLTPTDSAPSYNRQEQLYLHVDAGRYYTRDLKGNFSVFGEPNGNKQARALLWKADPHGNRIVFDRKDGRLVKITDSCQRVLNIVTDHEGKITEIYGPHPNQAHEQVCLVQYQYSQSGDLICVRDAYDEPFRYYYDNHLLVKETDRVGFSFYFEFDNAWQLSGDNTQAYCVKTWGDGNLFYRELTYDLENQYTQSVDSKGGVTHYYWNDMGVVTTEVNPVGGKSQTTFDESANKVSEVDALGNEYKYDYDDHGQLVGVTDPDGAQTFLQYDHRHNVIAITNAKGSVWKFEYDEFHNATARILPNEARLEYAYNQRGLLSQVKGEDSSQTFTWNGGLLYQVTNTQGLSQTFSHDFLGRNTAVEDYDKKVSTFDYDLLGQLVAKTNREGKVEHYGYNPRGQLINHTDALHRNTRYDYNYIALSKIELANGHFKQYHYDTELNLVQLVNENKDSCRFKYDQHERLIEEIAYDGRVQRYEYDEIDNLIHHFDGQFRSAQYLRNFKGHVLEKKCSDGEIAKFSYDPLGNLLSAENQNIKTQFEYDQLGNITLDQQGDAVLRHVYNGQGLRTQSILPNTDVLTFKHNTQGNVSEILYNDRLLSKSKYDQLGREVERQVGSAVQVQEYDVMGRLKNFCVQGKSHRVIDRGYGYDAAGNLKDIVDSHFGVTNISYDPLDRVTRSVCRSPEKFVFDPAGNVIDEKNAEHNGFSRGNRLLYFQDKHFEYDDVGNMVKESSGKAQCKVKQFSYNHQNQMVGAVVDGQTFHYQYDALGRRISKEDAFGKTTFVWNGNVLLSEQRKNIEKLYIYEPGSFRPLCQIQNNKFSYYHLDQIGLPREMTDEAGSMVWQAKYQVYGNVVSYTYEKVENNLRFQGQYFDTDTGLHYNRFRYYHPGVGRFINQDPIGLAGGEHLYEYSSNPFIFIDPLGLASKKSYKPDINGAKGPLDWSGVDKDGLTRKEHVKRHGVDQPNRASPHGVFNENPIHQTAEAFDQAKKSGLKPTKQANGNLIYEVPSPKAGIQGGNPSKPGHGQELNTITIVTKPNSNEVVTAYPSPP